MNRGLCFLGERDWLGRMAFGRRRYWDLRSTYAQNFKEEGGGGRIFGQAAMIFGRTQERARQDKPDAYGAVIGSVY